MTNTVKIVIADDHPIVLMGVKSSLASIPDIELCGEAQDSDSLIQLIKDHHPDLIITDYNMPANSAFCDGNRLLEYIHRHFPALKIIVLTMINNPLMLKHILSHGIQGILLKSESLSELRIAIEHIRKNEKYFSRPLLDLLSEADRQTNQPTNPLSLLSPKESEVLRLYISGQTITEIASTLHRSIKTISAQKNQAFRKLGLQNEKELYEYSIKHKL